MIRSRLILWLPILLALSAVGQAQAFSNDCSLQFAGSFRKAVKNRPAAAGATYTVHNDGQPITVADWFGLVCGFDPKLNQKNITTLLHIGGTALSRTLRDADRRVIEGIRQ